MLNLSNISIQIQGCPLLTFASLKIMPGQIVSLLGPSGSGKSTLLKGIAGLHDPDICVQGQIYLYERLLNTLPAHRRNLGYVEQRPTLFPHLNVRQNLAFGLKGARQEIDQALDIAGLQNLSRSDVATLSGGQAARVSLMRTLLSKPKALLLDEPFAALDMGLRKAMRDFVFHQVRVHRLPTLLVTHDPNDAASAQGPVFELESGGLRAHGDPHV